MTNEEAVKMLRTMQRTVYLGNRKFEDAIECAIKALSEPLQPWEVLVAQAVLPHPEPHWIPVTERLPEEEDSIFARYYGTDRWRKAMFRKKSREVIVTSVFEDGELHTEVAHTTDGKWYVGVNVVPRTVIAWMPLPEPYKEVTE